MKIETKDEMSDSKLRKCMNTGLCGVYEHYDDTVSKCQSTPGARRVGVSSSPKLSAASTAPFSLDDIARSKDAIESAHIDAEIKELQVGILGKIRNSSKIKRLENERVEHDLAVLSLYRLNAANNTDHEEDRNLPYWRHNASRDGNSYSNDMYWLYKEAREFRLVAESELSESPGHAEAVEVLHNRHLSPEDRMTLKNYFSNNTFNDGKDHGDPNSTYRKEQQVLNNIISKLPTLEKPITVWRGENLWPRSILDEERILDRIQFFMNLKPGDTYRFESCASTSTSLHIATSGYFCTPMGKPSEGINTNFDDWNLDENSSPSHGILFELETDRGVYIDNDLHQVGKSEEQEILMPMGMEYEVVGHAQVKDSEVTSHGSGNHAYHVIKLKLKR